MRICGNCGKDAIEKTLRRYKVPHLGIAVVLVNSTTVIECEQCGQVEYEIPDLCGLIAAAAIVRVNVPQRLSGDDIRFLRKALELTSKKLASTLGITPETLSRWENGKLKNVSISTEKLLRLIVINKLDAQAPGIDIDERLIIDMSINTTECDYEDLILELQLDWTNPKHKGPKKYTDIKAAA